jgi:hypothetical protein
MTQLGSIFKTCAKWYFCILHHQFPILHLNNTEGEYCKKGCWWIKLGQTAIISHWTICFQCKFSLQDDGSEFMHTSMFSITVASSSSSGSCSCQKPILPHQGHVHLLNNTTLKPHHKKRFSQFKLIRAFWFVTTTSLPFWHRELVQQFQHLTFKFWAKSSFGLHWVPWDKISANRSIQCLFYLLQVPNSDSRI